MGYERDGQVPALTWGDLRFRVVDGQVYMEHTATGQSAKFPLGIAATQRIVRTDGRYMEVDLDGRSFLLSVTFPEYLGEEIEWREPG